MQEERFSVVNMDDIIWVEWTFNCGTKSKKVAWWSGTQVKIFLSNPPNQHILQFLYNGQ